MQRSGKQTGGGQTEFGFASEDGSLSVLTAIADVLAGRNLAAYCNVLGDMRSIAPYCFGLGVAKPRALTRLSPTDSDAERNKAKREQAGKGRAVTRREVK